jgi:beta-mannosidase
LTSESAQLSIEIPLLGTLPKNAEVQLNIGDGQRLPVENVIFRKEKIRFSTRIPNPIIWKPRSSASPHLYQLEIEISASGRIFFRKEVKTGLRQVRLVREKDAVGEAFYFEVNGQPVFMKGANYVPPDPLIPRITIEKRRQILCAAKDAGMNFVRVWGGGYYEDDAFYDLCDSLGLMVWQDFMFACSMYPGDSAFLANVRAEVADNVLRLRNHPCIIHWNGNNEVDVAWHNWGWQRQFNISPQDSATMWRAYLAIFEDMIPAILTRLDPGRSYTPTSPISNWGKPENFNLGTMHYWGVWHGGDDFSAFRQNVGRFMNEYGFQSYPEMHTIEKFALPYQQKLDSEVMRDHQKSGNGNEKILREVRQLYGEPIDFEDFTYKSQLAQRDAMDAAIRAHRMGRGHCMGTAYWQLNDTWYGPSWSSIDYDGRWKALHHRLRELYADYLLDPRLEGDSLRIWLLAEGEESGSPPRPCKLVYQFQKFDGTQVAKSTFDIRPNLNRPAIAATIAMKPVFAKAKKEEMLLHCYLECDTTTGAYDSPVRLANTIFLFAPTKNLRLSKPKLKFSLSENVLQVESDTFVKDLFLEAPGVRYFHKNYFDLLPHERVEIPFEGTLNNLHLGRFRTCNPKN